MRSEIGASRRRAAPGSRATAHGRLFDAYLDDGTHLNENALAERISWALALIEEMTQGVLDQRWTDQYIGGTTRVGPAGQPMPRFAYKALERRGWAPQLPPHTHACSRMRRMAGELAGRTLRAGDARSQVMVAVLAGYPL